MICEVAADNTQKRGCNDGPEGNTNFILAAYSMYIYVYIIYSELDLPGTYMNDWDYGALHDSTLKDRTQNNEELTHPGLCS